MDLRHLKLSADQIKQLHQFIRERKLGYQPFIFTDSLQVGEGQRFRDGEFNPQCGEVLWEGNPPELDQMPCSGVAVPPPYLITRDRAAFQSANSAVEGFR